MKVALAQINPIVGDLTGNARKIVDFAVRAASEEADLVVFPEMCVTGYPPLDLLDSAVFIDASIASVQWIAEHVPADLGVLIGAPVRSPNASGKRLLNAAILLENGQEAGRAFKMLLPTYDVFDESRYFEPASEMQVLSFRGIQLGVSVCEDMWNVDDYAEYNTYSDDPLEELAGAGIDLFVNISASPFSVGKHVVRNDLLNRICNRFKLPFVLVNQVGANTEVLFDGDSRVHGADGTMLLCAPSFEESLLIWDSEVDSGIESGLDAPFHERVHDLHDALVMGIRDYAEKTGIFEKVLIGLSGGIDSAVTCALAVEALGAERVVGITLPSEISSPGSVEDSLLLARNLGIEFHDISIRPAVNAFTAMLESLFSQSISGIAEENIQARTRGLTLMAVSNKFGYLLLTTGNKSELSMGYATLYGDMSGGLAVLSDVFKTQVYEIAEYINDRVGYDVIPDNTLSKPPSAELSENQRDEDSLPPYAILDEILRRYIELREDVAAIVDGTEIDPDLVQHVLRAVDQNEYKRRQAAPGLRVSGKAFGLGRRLPIVMRYNRKDIDEFFGAASTSTAS